ADGDHLYVPDLDLFGHGSVFQLMGETATTRGEALFAGWLKAPATLSEVRTRQGAAKELAPLLDFRQDVLVEAGIVSQERADPSRFIDWAEGGPYLNSVRWARPLGMVLPFVTLTLYILGTTKVIPSALVWIGVFAQLLVAVAVRKPLADFYARMAMGEHGFVRFEEAFARIEAQPFQHERLRTLAGQLRPSGVKPVSEALRRFSFHFSFAQLKQSGQFYAVIQLFTLWDIHWLFLLESWRREHGTRVRGWFDSLAELEALSCLAGLAHDRPEFTYPEVVENGPLFEAKALGHPLLKAPVRNDVSLPGRAHALLLTGSNMSGKTTLLRAMGVNTVLALAGAPVCAESLKLSWLQALTSMRVKDSLERGVSYFYAEVQRIKKVLDAAEAANGRVLFLLDEILLGTNTRERQIASRELLKLLLKTGAIGGVTTHDLTLTALSNESTVHVRNLHFRDQLVDGKMAFDYRLREGVVETSNALRVLEQAGIHLPADAAQ
ncbi:MAG: MutS-related protein, partial [Myxococcaceae bacterium]